MTATDELRRLLDERGVEWCEPVQMEGSIFTRWNSDGVSWTASMVHGRNNALRIGASTVTPEQAIAATLGGGTLTAEQVRETVDKHWHDLSADYDMPEATALPEYSYDWQAIADELNAMLGRVTCKMEQIPECQYDDIECSECGVTLWAFSMDKAGEGVIATPNYCPYCGCKVEQ